MTTQLIKEVMIDWNKISRGSMDAASIFLPEMPFSIRHYWKFGWLRNITREY